VRKKALQPRIGRTRSAIADYIIKAYTTPEVPANFVDQFPSDASSRRGGHPAINQHERQQEPNATWLWGDGAEKGDVAPLATSDFRNPHDAYRFPDCR